MKKTWVKEFDIRGKHTIFVSQRSTEDFFICELINIHKS